MKTARFSALEKSGIAVSVMFIGVGIWSIIRPTPTLISHKAEKGPSTVEYVSKSGAKLYGVICVLVGSGIVVMVLFRPGK